MATLIAPVTHADLSDREGATTEAESCPRSALDFAGLLASPYQADAREFQAWGDRRGGFYVLPGEGLSTARALRRYAAAFPGLRPVARLTHPLIGPESVALSGDAVDELVRVLPRVGRSVNVGFRIAVPGAYRKITVAVFDAENVPRMFAKLPAHMGGAERVEREAEILRELTGRPELDGRIPSVLSLSRWHGLPLLVVDAGPRRAGRRTLAKEHWRFLAHLHTASTRVVTIEGSRAVARWNGLHSALVALPAGRTSGEVFGLAMERLRSSLQGVAIPVSLAHGDFTRSNTRRGRGGLFVFDWEAAITDALPGHDAFHFCVFRRMVRGRRPTMPAGAARWLCDVWPEASRYTGALWFAFLVEVGLRYSVARLRRPQEGNDHVATAAVAEIERCLALGAKGCRY